jgi:hypothetical protein
MPGEPSPEEQFKIWAFRRSLVALRKCPASDLAYLASKCPSLGRANVIAAGPGGEVPGPDASAQDRVVHFLQAAAVHVSGRNMDSLSAPALFVFGFLVGQRDARAFADADRAVAAAASAASSAPPPPPVAAAADEDGEAVPPALPAPLPPKLTSKNKLLAALNAMQFDEEPPAARSKALPADIQYDLERAASAERKAIAAKTSRTSTGSSNASVKAAPAVAPAPTAVTPAPAAAKVTRKETKAPTSAAAPQAAELAVSDSDAIAIQRKAAAPRGTKAAPAAPAPSANDAAAIAPAVARVVQVLTVTTAPVVADKLKSQGIVATVADVNAAIRILVAKELVVEEHGIFYPLC